MPLRDGEWEDAAVPRGENVVSVPIRDAFDAAHARLKRQYDEQRPPGQLSLELEQRPK